MATFTLEALAAEIEADPQAIGYKEANGDWKGDAVIAALLNDPANGAQIYRTNVPMDDVFAEVDWVNDWLNLTGTRNMVTDKQQAFRLITSTAVLDANSSFIRDALQGVFGGTTGGTLGRLNALLQKQGSRAEVLWGDGATVSVGDVARAANI